MELRAIKSEEPSIGERITEPGDFVVLTEREPESRTLPRPGVRWFRRLLDALLFTGFLAALSTLSLFLLSL